MAHQLVVLRRGTRKTVQQQQRRVQAVARLAVEHLGAADLDGSIRGHLALLWTGGRWVAARTGVECTGSAWLLPAVSRGADRSLTSADPRGAVLVLADKQPKGRRTMGLAWQQGPLAPGAI